VKAAGQEFHSVRGPFRFNNNNLPVQNYYVFQVVKESGQAVSKQLAVALPDHMDAYYAKCALK
jgi:branched-chain amino acid transport system substrate-binding protein